MYPWGVVQFLQDLDRAALALEVISPVIKSHERTTLRILAVGVGY